MTVVSLDANASESSAPIEAVAARRTRASVRRIGRAHAIAGGLFGGVFGDDSATVAALDARVDRVLAAQRGAMLRNEAAELHAFSTWLAAIAETIELESVDAADLQPYLATIIGECDALASLER